jgi:tetratricopeptide (TPR) repeat protein
MVTMFQAFDSYSFFWKDEFHESQSLTGLNDGTRRTRPSEVCFLLLWGFAFALHASAASANIAETAPTTPRDFFNTGTQKLQQGKLREAEAFLENAVASQAEVLQPPALYNLGHVRFQQGVEELKKGPAAGPSAARGRAAAVAADEAIRAANEALASDDLQKMVAAYIRGRGVRKELKAAIKTVKEAMETHGTALSKWQRSSGDFKSTVELNHNDADALQNANAVDRRIAKLIDSIRQLQQAAGAMGQKLPDLGDKLAQLKGKIPAPDMPPGAAGDDEEDEEMPKGPEPGQKENTSREGKEMDLSPEMAGWLLDSFKLDTERRLPMGGKEPADPKDRTRPTW